MKMPEKSFFRALEASEEKKNASNRLQIAQHSEALDLFVARNHFIIRIQRWL